MVLNTVLLSLLACFLCVIAFAYVNKVKINKADSFKNKLVAGFPSTKKRWFYLVSVCLASCCVVAMLCLFYERDILFVIKHIIVLALLCPICLIDYREKRIPNFLIIIGLCARVAILLVEMLVSFAEIKHIIISDLLATLIIAGFTLLFIFISRGGIGAGDFKLFIVMALLLGQPGIYYALFFSFFVSFIVAIFLLITKKKGRKDSIAFGPMVLCGTVLSMIVSGM